jgi:hypothetical protein
MENQTYQGRQNTVWKCSLCAVFVAVTLRVLMNHYYTVHSNEVNFSIRCGVDDCPATFQRYHSFYKHVKKKHRRAYDNSFTLQPLDDTSSTESTIQPTDIGDVHNNISYDWNHLDLVSTDEESTQSETDGEDIFQVHTCAVSQ